MPLDYHATLDYLYARLPMFQRIGAAALKKDLANTYALCEALGNPHLQFRSVHVAGTNGKGSCSHLIASVLQHAGYKTGLYTSPHLKEFTERIRVNGLPVDKHYVVAFVKKIRPVIERIEPSFFEVTVAMAFDYFAAQGVDVAVVEVGLGGRLDSTNVIRPLVSLITNIGLDHKDLLGDTLQAIAKEKAGIIKEHVPVVVSEYQQEVSEVFLQKARAAGSKLEFASRHYEVREISRGVWTVMVEGNPFLENITLDLVGKYQGKNLPGVLSVIRQLQSLGFTISEEQIRRGLACAAAATGLKGRWQQLGVRPLVFCDVAHNAEGIAEVLATMEQYRYERLLVVMGVVKDKDAGALLGLMPRHARYWFCQADIPRAMDAHRLQQLAAGYGLQGEAVPDVNEALAAARAAAGPNDFIFIGGSTFVVAELKEL